MKPTIVPDQNKKPKKNTQLVVSTHLKNISQIGSFPQVGMKIKNVWNHHLDTHPRAPFKVESRDSSTLAVLGWRSIWKPPPPYATYFSPRNKGFNSRPY